MEKSIIENVVSGFKKAATELEELQLQLALGKAEAKDKFESMKKRFNTFVHDAELKADDAKEWASDMRTKFDELRVQLALGKAETKDAFEIQRKKINAKMHEIENYIQSHPQLAKAYDYMQTEFERVKLELEILAVNFQLAATKSNDSIQKRREEMAAIIKGLQDGLEKHKNAEEPSRHENFRNEIKQAYHHLKAAFA
ncbi:MAG: hypothetical protein IPO32_20205 [Crocinitomicaceae bacterium]|nr:hypothetical protein [Crocinitomicaceae bacterium]